MHFAKPVLAVEYLISSYLQRGAMFFKKKNISIGHGSYDKAGPWYAEVRKKRY